ncbi:MAG: DUF2141 domain-containing protein [Polyangiaceae bacterium]|nr:DUF2141 domain-containing protein [Polyangiaceae bacterium]
MTAPTVPMRRLVPQKHLLALTFATMSSALFVSGAWGTGPAKKPRGDSEISVSVSPRNRKGALACALYASPKGFPGAIGSARATERKAIPAGEVRCTFAGLPKGTYAVAVVHDENGNGKLDTNFLGMPTEGWGTTNNVKPLMSAPTFEDSKVKLPEHKRLALRVRLNY